mmetsp:Transcript_37205/g.78887  ORF Transcript_37205/g.78887 Transcript_37205/m.78887 type:complete len:276 (+) Transcript_37205:147-974(+)
MGLQGLVGLVVQLQVQSDDLLQVVGQLTVDLDFFSWGSSGHGQHDLGVVQEHPIADHPVHHLLVRFAVSIIPHQGEPHVLHVLSNLMGPPGDNAATDQGVPNARVALISIIFLHLVPGLGLVSVHKIDLCELVHSWAALVRVVGVHTDRRRADGCLDHPLPLVRPDLPVDKAKVVFIPLVLVALLAKLQKGLRVGSDHQHTTGEPIQSVRHSTVGSVAAIQPHLLVQKRILVPQLRPQPVLDVAVLPRPTIRVGRPVQVHHALRLTRPPRRLVQG